MKKLFRPLGTLFLLAATLTGFAAAPAGITAKKGDGPLRFKHHRHNTANGLFALPGNRKPSLAPQRLSTSGRPELIANCTSSTVGYGMYSFFAEDNLALTPVAETPAFFGGAVYVNGKYYGADYNYDSSNQLTYVRWYVYDALTWHCEKVVENPLDFSYIATDRTYDSTTGTVYSICYDRTGSSIWLSTTSLSDGAPAMIAPLEKDVIMIAADANGQLFGIDTSANLYRIDKSTAALTLVGNTNIYPDYLSEYTQTITFDHTTGTLYWAEFHSEGFFSSSSALFEVNPANAQTSKIADLPGGPEMIGMYVADYIQPGVPATPTDLTLTCPQEGGYDYTFSFTAPTVTVDGEQLPAAENITVEVSVDGDLLDIKEALPGAAVTSGPFTMTRGLHTLKIAASNANGTGATVARMFFAGYDVPGTVTNLRLSNDGNSAVLTWDAPLGGAEGGSVRQPLTYNVTRMPGNVAVATGISQRNFTEENTLPACYSYIVTPVSPDGEGTPLESNTCVMGSFNVPYSCAFDTEDEFDLYTVIDITSNGKVWNYDEENKRLRHPWSLNDEIDDYIVTPGIRMDADKSYQISFDSYQMVANYDEHVMLYFGDRLSPDDLTFVLDTGKLPEEPEQYTAVVAPSHDGVYHFAFRSKTGKNGFMSYVDNVSVTEKGTSAVPAPVNDLEVKAADGGVLEATVSFTAPSTTLGGAPLASIERIDIFRGESNEPIRRFSAPAPGSRQEWIDNSVTTGTYTYRVVTFTAAGASEPSAKSVFVGIDTPLPPTDFDATGSEGERRLSWSAPAAGVNGGNLNGLLTYRLCRMVNDEETVIVEELAETEYTDTWTTDTQAFVYYTVTAVTEAGESETVPSRSFPVGKPYELPYAESFAGGESQTAPWSVELVVGLQGEWKLDTTGENPFTEAQDGDNGMATFDGYHAWSDGVELRLISPTINISRFEDPRLTFFIYHYNGLSGWWQETPDPVGETMTVEISVDGQPFEAVPQAEYTLYAEESGWKEYTVDLSAYRKSPGVRIAFRGIGAGCFNIHIDNIEIAGTREADGIGQTANAGAIIAGEKGAIRFSGCNGSVRVFDMAGRLTASSRLTEGRIALPAGIYVVTAGSDVRKVTVK